MAIQANATAPLGTRPVTRSTQGRFSARWFLLAPAAIVVIIAIVGPFVVPFSPTHIVGPTTHAPDGTYLFGTDHSGMDVFSRVIVATRLNLIIASTVTVVATLLGTIIGLALGMNESRGGVRGVASGTAGRAVELFQAIPAVVVGLVVVTFFGANPVTLVIVTAIVVAPFQIRLMRTEVSRVRKEGYLDAARLAGFTEREIAFRHVLPNSIPPVLTNMTVVFGTGILLVAALGFIGVGLAPPTPEWGSMIALGSSDAAVGNWWPALFPALALMLTVASAAMLRSFLAERGEPRR